MGGASPLHGWFTTSMPRCCLLTRLPLAAPPLPPPNAASSGLTAAGTATGPSASPTAPGLAARRWRQWARAG